MITYTPNNRMQSDFDKLRLPQPLMRSVMRQNGVGHETSGL